MVEGTGIMFRRDGGKIAIDKKAAFCELMESLPFRENELISNKLEEWDRFILSIEPNVSRGALNNSHGDWYEWILAISAWNLSCNKNSNKHILLLPNVSSFNVGNLYLNNIQQIVNDLKEKSRRDAGVNFVTSNPDFVYIRSNEIFSREPISIQSLNVDGLNRIEDFFKNFKSKLSLEDLIGFLSVKTSFRPDRRLQIAHEGSVLKSIHSYIANQKRQSNAKPLLYYAISTRTSDADKTALRTLAAHSITSDSEPLTTAVDDVIEINSLLDADSFFATLV